MQVKSVFLLICMLAGSSSSSNSSESEGSLSAGRSENDSPRTTSASILEFPSKCNNPSQPCGRHGKCDEHARKCVCPTTYTAKGDVCVDRIFQLPTSPHATCETYGASKAGDVTNRKCICDEDYFMATSCVPASFPANCTEPGIACSNKHGVCSYDKRCACLDGYYANVNRECVKYSFEPANVTCPDNAACADNTGYCKKGRCFCLPGLFVYGRKCFSSIFNPTRPCKEGERCGDGHGTCHSWNQCICDEGYFRYGEVCAVDVFELESGVCPGTGFCGPDGFCEGNGVCRCSGKNFAKHGECVKAFFTDSPDCVDGKKACSMGLGVCDGHTCSCINGAYVRPHYKACVSTVFENPNCIKGMACSLGKGTCVSGTRCECLPDYIAYPDIGGNVIECVKASSDYFQLSRDGSMLRADFWLVVLQALVAASFLHF
ncbi:hypothetical protein BaRGS_00022983 [Batillaria attramentaria]|uniref:EGF-like domain-containing protein n=1 Tax=Batillaria attramentaria TaxID=370345 RepID=A0ABD0KFE4_9CAEN